MATMLSEFQHYILPEGSEVKAQHSIKSLMIPLMVLTMRASSMVKHNSNKILLTVTYKKVTDSLIVESDLPALCTAKIFSSHITLPYGDRF